MSKLRVAALFVLMIAWGFQASAQQQPSWIIKPLNEETGWVGYDYAKGIAMASNGVYVAYGGAVLTADTVTVNTESGEVVADGNVRIIRDDQVWTSAHIRYNFKPRQLDTRQFRT